MTERARRWRGPLKAVAAVAVLAALGWQIRQLLHDWTQHGGSIGNFRPSLLWLVASAAAYVAAQFGFGAFWRVLLRVLRVDPPRWELFRAFCVGTLGKYIPGKAMVLVMRTGMISRGDAGRFPVALSVFFETTTEMLVGCIVACLCLLLVVPGAWMFWGGAGATAIVVAVGLSPPLFTRAAQLASLPFSAMSVSSDTVKSWFRSLRRPAILFSVTGWLLFGASFWAVMMALGAPCASLFDFTFLTGVTALAVAGGFLFFFLPSGIGIRELIIIHLLAPRYGQSQAVIASLILRTVWTVAETLLAGVLYWRNPMGRRLAVVSPSDETRQSLTA